MSEMEKDMQAEAEKKQQSDINTDAEAQDQDVKEENNSTEEAEEKPKAKSRKRRGKSSKEDKLKEEIEELKTQQLELNDKYLRLFSEFDNYRKRTNKEKAELYKTAAEDTILAILPIVDDLERGLKSLEGADETHIQGMELIYNKLIGILKQKGVESIHESDVDFDLDIHEAITKIPAPSEELKGKVVDIVEKGYMLQGKVIRFAKAVIGE
jgi:molecular chaperone GrpE